jgi:hypothetical protein
MGLELDPDGIVSMLEELEQFVDGLAIVPVTSH